jgi:hypothetical protein
VSSEDASLERLRAALDELADEDASELVREARLEARARVRGLLVDAMAERLLDRAEASVGELAAGERPTAPPKPPRAEAAPRAQPTPPAADSPERDVEDRRPAADRDAPHGWYVYGVVPGGQTVEPVAGIDPTRTLRVLGEGSLAVLTSEVQLDEFGEEALREHLEDVVWLERMARRHEEVLESVLRDQTTVVPMRLFTIYGSEESLREMLARERDFLLDALERLAGRTEWGAKLFTRADAEGTFGDEDDEGEEIESRLAEARPGESYMLRRRLADVRAEASSRLLQARSEETHSRLAALAVEARLNPLQPQELTDHDGEMILNGVYLVDADAAEEFLTAARQLQEEHEAGGLELVITGPWPPYNFVNRSDEGER